MAIPPEMDSELEAVFAKKTASSAPAAFARERSAGRSAP